MEMLVAQMIFLQSSQCLIWVEVTPYISLVVAMVKIAQSIFSIPTLLL